MKASGLQLSAIMAIAVLVGTMATACDGGGNGEPLTMEEYFQGLEALVTDIDDRGKETEAKFDEAFESVGSEEDMLSATKDFLSATVPIMKDFVDGLDGLIPPAEAKEAHDKVVEDARKVLESFEETVEKLEGTDDPTELE